MRNISFFFIYLVCIFGAVDIITAGIKPKPNAILFCILVATFIAQLMLRKRYLIIDIGILLFALLSSFGFSLFISDSLFTPISIAFDCLGHKPERTHFLDIILIGLAVTTIMGVFFLKTHKAKNLFDRLLSFLFLLILTFSYLKFKPIVNLNKAIDKVSMPIQTLPASCN